MIRFGSLNTACVGKLGSPYPVFCRAELREALVAVLATRPRPDEAVAVFTFDDGVVEEVGVDRSSEARIVELEAQIVAALI